jgi:hypothetical protein
VIRAKSNDINDINRALSMLEERQNAAIATVDDSKIEAAVSRALRSSAVQSSLLLAIQVAIQQLQLQSDLYALKKTTINGESLASDIVLDALEIEMGNGDDRSVYTAINAMLSLINITGSVPTWSALPASANEGDVYIVNQDETHNNHQTLWRYKNLQWEYLADFSVALDNYYTKAETYNKNEINLSQEQQTQQLTRTIETAISNEVIARNEAIETKAASTLTSANNFTTQQLAAAVLTINSALTLLQEGKADKSIRINGHTLHASFDILAREINLLSGTDVQTAIDLLSG